VLTHSHSHLAFWHTVRARKVDLEGICASILTPSNNLLPRALTIFFHDGRYQHTAHKLKDFGTFERITEIITEGWRRTNERLKDTCR
jgi:hypothetical protein